MVSGCATEATVAAKGAKIVHYSWRNPYEGYEGYRKMGDEAYEARRYSEALDYYSEAARISEHRWDGVEFAWMLYNIGEVYRRQRQYQKSLEYYSKSLEIREKLKRKMAIAHTLHRIGDVNYAWGRYDQALEYYRKALAVNEELGRKKEIAGALHTIGVTYYWQGHYDRAIESLQKALILNEGVGNKYIIARSLQYVGNVYRAWGKYDPAREYLHKALAIWEDLKDKDNAALCLKDIGITYSAQNHYKPALDAFQKSLAIFEAAGNKVSMGICLYHIGKIYQKQGKYDQALEYHLKTLAMHEAAGYQHGMALSSRFIVEDYISLGQYDLALKYAAQTLKMDEDLGEKPSMAKTLRLIGTINANKKDYEAAINYFERAVALTDELRLTAVGAVRRDYLAAQIASYELLVDAYFRNRSFRSAFNALEAASCKYLVEQLQGKLGTPFEVFDSENYRRKLAADTAVISFANMDRKSSFAFTVDREGVSGVEIPKKQFISAVTGRYDADMAKAAEKIRGVLIKGKGDGKAVGIDGGDKEADAIGDEDQNAKATDGVTGEKAKEVDVAEGEDEEDADMASDDANIPAFRRIIEYYRQVLINNDPSEEPARKQIARELYNLLFGGIERNLAGKTDLVIIPNSVLAMVPFESLIMPDGRYLAERFNIKYSQSLSVLELIEKRRFSPDRKPLIAFGGAVYDQGKYAAEMITNEVQLKSALVAFNRGADGRQIYAGLGYSWPNLPGTLTEVKAIKSLVSGADIYAGSTVTKANFKQLAQRGELGNYKVIHLATHSLVVPEAPELSAVVFSQVNPPSKDDDGYLRAGEILDFNLHADFVNLSACETGLGKLYKGEGVVGLTQSFLMAGANGLSVSLWQVVDESTMEFMVGLYRLVSEKGLSYDRAMTEMRRKFINDPKWNSPRYWSPFVYYGK